eukprot:SAG11_NODE_1227_length_5474_cov_5.294326_6_plen_138_part_01
MRSLRSLSATLTGHTHRGLTPAAGQFRRGVFAASDRDVLPMREGLLTTAEPHLSPLAASQPIAAASAATPDASREAVMQKARAYWQATTPVPAESVNAALAGATDPAADSVAAQSRAPLALRVARLLQAALSLGALGV